MLLFGFIAMPLCELYLLIEVGSVIGALPAIGLCIATAALGAALVRSQGLRTLRDVHGALGRGEVPAVAMLEGVVLAIAGVLLLTPGLITDAWTLRSAAFRRTLDIRAAVWYGSLGKEMPLRWPW